MKMKWSRQVDAFTLECLISVHHRRSELNMKSSEEKKHFLQKAGFTVMNKMIQAPSVVAIMLALRLSLGSLRDTAEVTIDQALDCWS